MTAPKRTGPDRGPWNRPRRQATEWRRSTPEGAGTSGTVSLGDIGATLVRRWRSGMAAFLLVLAAAGALGVVWPVSYSATAVVAVSPLALDPNGTRQVELNIATERVIVRSRQVATAAAESLGPDVDPGDLQSRTTVTIPQDSDALEISVSASSPEAASDAANAFAEAYLAYRSDESADFAANVSQGIEAQIDTLLASLTKSTSVATRALVQQQVADLRSQKSALTGTGISPGAIVSRAVTPASPSSPGLALFIAAGIAAATLAGFSMALLAEHLDTKVRSAALLNRQVTFPVVDGRAYDLESLMVHIGFLLDAHRREAGLQRMKAPAVVLLTPGASREEFAHRLRDAGSFEIPESMVVIAEPGEAGVAHAIASEPSGALFVVVCRVKDRLTDVRRIDSALGDWGREPSLVLIAPEPASLLAHRRSRIRHRLRRIGGAGGKP